MRWKCVGHLLGHQICNFFNLNSINHGGEVSDNGFLRHCQLKNLAPHTYTYYKENLQFFFDSAPQVKFVDEFNQETIENFIGQLLDKGNRVS